MHILLSSLLAIASLQLANAEHPAKARITQAPAVGNLLLRRQDVVCPSGGYTACEDGYGCCEVGAPCTTVSGQPACDSPCSGLPCGDGICCDIGQLCSSSLGYPICANIASGSGIGGIGFDESTLTPDLPDEVSSEEAIPTTFTISEPSTTDDSDFETTSTPEDAPTIPTAAATPTPTFTTGDDDDDLTTTQRPTQTSSSGDESNSSGGEQQQQSGGNNPQEGGAGFVSVKGALAVWVLALAGGIFLMR